MTEEIIRTYSIATNFGVLALVAVAHMVYIALMGQPLLTRRWPGQVLRWFNFLGWLLLGAGATLRIGFIADPADLGNMLFVAGLAAVLAMFVLVVVGWLTGHGIDTAPGPQPAAPSREH